MLLRSLVILDECHGAKGKSPMAELLRLLKLAGIARCFLQVILVIFSRGKNLLRAVFAGGRRTCVPRREEEHVVHFHFFFRAVIGEVGLIEEAHSSSECQEETAFGGASKDPGIDSKFPIRIAEAFFS